MLAQNQLIDPHFWQDQETGLELASKERSNKEINAAGKVLCSPTELHNRLSMSQAILVVSDWRSSHELAMKKVMLALRRHVRINNHTAIISGRSKRLVSIAAKLNREGSMALSTMQDIAGCRVVLDSVANAEIIASSIRGELTAKLSTGRAIKEKNYIDIPKPDGYRSIHFVVSYKGPAEIKARKVEIQVRSLLQHRWATALEAVDLFTGQTLKTGGGDSRWRQFFAVSSSIFAAQENRSPVPGIAASLLDLHKQMNSLAKELRVVRKLQAWTNVIRERSDLGPAAFAYTYLVELDVDKGLTNIASFGPDQLEEAQRRYLAAEIMNNNHPSRSAVLVKAYSIGEVHKAFPGYYGDTKAFLKALSLT